MRGEIMLLRGLVLLFSAALTVAAPLDEVLKDVLSAEGNVSLSTRSGEDSSIMFLTQEDDLEEAAPVASFPHTWRPPVDVAVARRVTRLALKLQGAIRQRDAANTLLFSPLSVSGALHLLWLGARGRTADELANFLDMSSDVGLNALLPSHQHLTRQLTNTSGVLVDFANGLFLQHGYPVRRWFANISQEVFSTEVYGVEFATNGEVVTSQINGWVSRKTRGRINKFLQSPLPSNTKVLITNAVYFNGEWEYPFSSEITFLRSYTIPKEDGEAPEVLKVLMMSNSGELPYTLNKELNCQVVGLPYKGRQVTMYLVLPIEKGLGAFRSLEQNLTVDNIERLREDMVETSVIISVPRMRIQSTFLLRETAEDLGVKTVFDPLEADLGGMSPGKPLAAASPTSGGDNSSSNTSAVDFQEEVHVLRDNPGLFVDDMIHKVEIEVTETGTIASAVTAVTVTRDGSRLVLRFDRPFLFFIRHEPTGLLLFWGSVLRPIT